MRLLFFLSQRFLIPIPATGCPCSIWETSRSHCSSWANPLLAILFFSIIPAQWKWKPSEISTKTQANQITNSHFALWSSSRPVDQQLLLDFSFTSQENDGKGTDRLRLLSRKADCLQCDEKSGMSCYLCVGWIFASETYRCFSSLILLLSKLRTARKTSK